MISVIFVQLAVYSMALSISFEHSAAFFVEIIHVHLEEYFDFTVVLHSDSSCTAVLGAVRKGRSEQESEVQCAC
jgi:hypothetical protein